MLEEIEKDSLPKKVLPRQFKASPKQKRSVSINIVTATKAHKRNKTSNSIHLQKEPPCRKEDKNIQTDPEPIPFNRKIPSLALPQANNKSQNSKSSCLPLISSTKSSAEFKLEDFEREFLLKQRAKRFIMKIKKEKDETSKKLSEIKDRLKESRERKMKEEDQERKKQKQMELIRKKEKVDHILRKQEFNRQRLKEAKKRRLLQPQRASRTKIHHDIQEQKDRQELDQILANSSGKISSSPKKKASPTLRIQTLPQQQKNSHARKEEKTNPFQSMDGKSQRKLVRGQQSQKKPEKKHNRGVTEGKFSTNLQKHLYLSLDDQNLLERIKQNIQKLETLGNSDILPSKGPEKKHKR